MNSKNIKLVIAFGSQVNGRIHHKSDTDIAVLGMHPLSLDEKIEFSESIAKKLEISEENIDLVDLWNASPLLQYEIAKNGKLLEGEISDFIRFKVLAWKRYQDTEKFRKAREKSLHTHVH